MSHAASLSPRDISLQRIHDLELLEQIARDVTSTLDLDQVLTLILERVKASLDAEAASVMLVEAGSQALVFRAASSANAALLLQQRIPPGVGIAGWVAQTATPLIVTDPARDPRFYADIDRIDGFVTRTILAVPLKVQDRLLGVLEALNKHGGGFTTEDERLLMLVASWAAIAIENARLYTEATERAHELAVRNEVSQRLSAATDLQGLLNGVTAHLAEVAGADACMILLGDPQQETPLPVTIYANGQILPNVEPKLDRVTAMLRREVPMTGVTILPDLLASGYLTEAEIEHAPARALLILPLLIGDVAQGVVLLGHSQPGRFSQRDVERVQPLTQQVALAVRKALVTDHLAEMVEARTRELRSEQARLNIIHEIGQVAVSTLDPAMLLRAAARQIRDAFGYLRVRIWMGDSAALSLTADAGGPNASPSRYIPIANDSLPGWVAAHHQQLYVPDLALDTARRVPDGGLAVRSAVGVPLRSQTELVGVLEAHSDQVEAFSGEDLSTLETVAGRLAMALKNARLFERVARGEREWETTFDAIAEGVVVHDEQLVIIRANHALAVLLDTAPEALIGHDVSTALCGGELPECATVRSDPQSPLSLELNEPRRGRTLAITGYPIARGGGGGRVLVVRDVTDERIWRARMLQTEKLASLGQLSAGIAHEINNPLGFIHSNLNTLSRYASELRTLFAAYHTAFAADPRLAACDAGIDPDFILQDLDQAITESQEGVERVQSIVTGLKNFARADESTELKAIDLHTALETALKIAWNEIKYKATVDKDYGVLPQVRCNPYRIGQVFINLLVNAAQAIQGEGRISLRTSAVDDWVEISIQDTGQGIPAENLPKLYDPFFTTKEIGKGTGLGLSVVYGIVNEHGGQIDVASRPGQGTTFTIYLPVAGPAQSEADPVREDNHAG